MTPAFVYIVQCNDGTLYIGMTGDVAARVARHNKGAGAKYTRGRRPVVLVYEESLPNRTEAARRERALKRLDRKAKMELINGTRARQARLDTSGWTTNK